MMTSNATARAGGRAAAAFATFGLEDRGGSTLSLIILGRGVVPVSDTPGFWVAVPAPDCCAMRTNFACTYATRTQPRESSNFTLIQSASIFRIPTVLPEAAISK